MRLHGSPREPRRNRENRAEFGGKIARKPRENFKTRPPDAAMMPDMAETAYPAKPLTVLVSEGNSTSAREAITILGLSGHRIEVCDPSPVCLARFSRFVRKFHRCPPMRDDPAGYLHFIEQLLAAKRFDVLLPTHEQGFVFARVGEHLAGRVGLALPSFENYRMVHNKAGFSRLLDRLGVPQPPTRIVRSEAEFRAAARLPVVVKTSVSTASRGIWFVREASDLESAVQDLRGMGLCTNGVFADDVLLQDFVAGPVGKAQAVFCRGQMLGFQGYRQIAAGAGGGEAIKQSDSRADVRAHLAAIGAHLDWHGALSVDYVLADDKAPLLIDCNPRLVEPMIAYLAGIDLVGLLLAVSLGQTPKPLPPSRDGVRTHLAMQALLGCASRGGSRRDLVREGFHLATGSAAFADSSEELTPLRQDWISIVPLAMVAIALLFKPTFAATLANKGWGAHLLDLGSIRRIADENFG
jgi:predicted ATP-grasp superfamily ATP-dependent carboligase